VKKEEVNEKTMKTLQYQLTGVIAAALAATLALAMVGNILLEADARINDGVGAKHAAGGPGGSCALDGDRCAFNGGDWDQDSAGMQSTGGGVMTDCTIDGGGTSSPGYEEFNGMTCNPEPVAPITTP
jgi:hypothetical protein